MNETHKPSSDAGADPVSSGKREVSGMSVQRYVVVENTPGYLPDDDDPAVFEDEREALRYLVQLVRESRDFSVEGGADIDGWLDREAGCAFLVDAGRPHDLGRYFEILPVQDES